MNKYEKAVSELRCNTTFVSDYDEACDDLEELVDKDTNGIYISKEEAKELLEALEMLYKRAMLFGKCDLRPENNIYVITVKNDYIKLRNALGGE